MSHLTPHPWDALAPALPPGARYPTVDLAAEEARVRALIRQAVEYDDRAEEYEADAEEERNSAEEARNEAHDLIDDEIQPQDADLADRLHKAVDVR